MAKIVTNLTDVIRYINTLYEGDSDPPTSGDEDFAYWVSLVNIAIDLWENEEGVLWKELFVPNVQNSTSGDKQTIADTHSYSLPNDFRFPASGIVWLGSGSSKTPIKVISPEESQLYSNSGDYVCWFTGTTLEFNPNMNITGGYDINYGYYKYASRVSNGSDIIEMADPMFTVYYALSELRRDEGDNTSAVIASQKMEGMKTKNVMPTWFQDSFTNIDVGFGS